MTQSRPAYRLTAPVIQVDPLPAHPDMTGCPWHDIKEKLREVGLLDLASARTMMRSCL